MVHIVDGMRRGSHAHRRHSAENQSEMKPLRSYRVSHVSTPLLAMSPTEF